jgi:hypothetical protein
LGLPRLLNNAATAALIAGTTAGKALAGDGVHRQTQGAGQSHDA